MFFLIHKEKDSAFGIQFPDFEGFFSAVDKEENLITNAVEELQLYCEEMNILPTGFKI
ncbi:type II toxin-antitoxin system HicB family antitoxin [Bartonella koehlerae]|uniref:type II toxin-antitoxin system HicB family antitoxin n=1 Tax=Bartonella koehlerae TaxID=92181 RepID=UPI00315B19FE